MDLGCPVSFSLNVTFSNDLRDEKSQYVIIQFKLGSFWLRPMVCGFHPKQTRLESNDHVRIYSISKSISKNLCNFKKPWIPVIIFHKTDNLITLRRLIMSITTNLKKL